jgi:hypothetical protein
MDLTVRQTTAAQAANTVSGGRADLDVAAGKPLNIRYKVGTEWVDVLNVEVPRGKVWAVSIGVEVVETDA